MRRFVFFLLFASSAMAVTVTNDPGTSLTSGGTASVYQIASTGSGLTNRNGAIHVTFAGHGSGGGGAERVCALEVSSNGGTSWSLLTQTGSGVAPFSQSYDIQQWTGVLANPSSQTYLIRVSSALQNSAYTYVQGSFTIVWPFGGGTAQTVALTPTSASTSPGAAVSFTASGGANSYVWTASDGGTITGSGATVTASWSTSGSYTVSCYNSAGLGYAQSNTATASVSVAATAQTISVIPGPSSPPQVVIRGKQILFTASGGNNDYAWSIASISGSETGGIITLGGTNKAQALVTFSDLGDYIISVYNKAGGAYQKSNTVQIEIVTVTPNTFTLPFKNTADHAIKFNVYQGTTLIESFVLAGGASITKVYELDSSVPLRWATVDGLVTKDGPVWLMLDPGDHGTPEIEKDGGTVSTDTSTPPTTPLTPPSTVKTAPPDPSGQSVWTSITAGNKNLTLTAVTFGEGTGKIVEAVNEVRDSLNMEGVMPDAGTETYDTDASSITTSKVLAIADHLPTAPVILMPGKVSFIQFRMAMARFRDTPVAFDISYDLTPYETQVLVIRRMALGCLFICFYFVFVKTVKGAFA